MRPSDATGDCGWFRELAAEFALGLVTGHERDQALTHLQSCPACCWHTARLATVCDRLRSLIPSTETPVGFEQRVLLRREAAEAQAHTRAGMPRRVHATAAAMMIAVGFAGGWWAHTATRAPPRPTAVAVAAASPLMAGTQHVGDVVVRVEHPQSMSVYLVLARPGRLTCQVLRSGGSLAATENYQAAGDVESRSVAARRGTSRGSASATPQVKSWVQAHCHARDDHRTVDRHPGRVARSTGSAAPHTHTDAADPET